MKQQVINAMIRKNNQIPNGPTYWHWNTLEKKCGQWQALRRIGNMNCEVPLGRTLKEALRSVQIGA